MRAFRHEMHDRKTLYSGGSRGHRRHVPPVRVQILSFWHTKFSKRSRLGSWRPPYGKSWIRYCFMWLFRSLCWSLLEWRSCSEPTRCDCRNGYQGNRCQTGRFNFARFQPTFSWKFSKWKRFTKYSFSYVCVDWAWSVINESCQMSDKYKKHVNS